ncbi:MAG: WG repeat-containing protein [Ignavibacteriales bacterium]
MKKKLVLIGIILAVAVLIAFFIIKAFLTPKDMQNPNTPGQPETNKQENFIYPAYNRVQNEYKWGYIDENGNFVINPQFDKAEDFMENGMARIYSGEKVGLIDRSGRMVLNPEFQYISDFSEGRAVTYNGNEYQVIDEKGKTVFLSPYEINTFHEGLAVCVKDAGEGKRVYGYIDKNGNLLFKPQFVFAYDFAGGKALAKIKDKEYIVVDKAGKIISLLNYNNVRELSEGILVFSDDNNEKFGYLKVDGKILIEPKFSRADKFEKGYAIVNEGESFSDEKVGVINTKGEFAIKPEYSDIFSIGEGLYYVGQKGAIPGAEAFVKKAVVSSKGTFLTGFNYYDVAEVKNGYISVSDDNSTFLIDIYGKKAQGFPVVNGRGRLTVVGNLIKAEIDEGLKYYSKEGKLIWQSENTYNLKNGAAVKETKFRPDIHMLIRYPQFSNHPDKKIEEGLNKKLKEIFVGNNSGSRKENGNYVEDVDISYDITSTEELIIVTKNQYYYPFGAAHGMPYMECYHININTGTFYKLGDLFKKDSKYIEKLSAIVKEQISEKSKGPDNMFFPDAFEKIKPEQSFIISDDKIQLFFQPYEIAAYAAGFPTFDIPFSKINDIIDKEGYFWKSFKKNIM